MMLRRLKLMVLTVTLLVVAGGRVMGQYVNEIENLKRENARIRLGMQETEKSFQEQYRRLVAHITGLQENLVQMQDAVKEYQRRIVSMENLRQQIQADNAAMKQQLQAEIAELRRQLDNESRQRQAAMQKLIETLAARSAAMASASSSAASSSTAASSASGGKSGGDAVPPGEYFEYEVQKGATLGAIARAYKVSVDDIRKANKLKEDTIYVGQKLLIPKK